MMTLRYFAVYDGHDCTTKGIRHYRIVRCYCDFWTARLLRYLPTVVN
jgi:hypothetical protein